MSASCDSVRHTITHQAEGSLSVQPYSHEPYRPDSDDEATENEQPGGAEGGRYGLESIRRLQHTEW